MLLDPWYRAKWRMMKKREVPGGDTRVTGEDTVAFTRIGIRPDSLDIMYSLYSFYVGLKWE